MSAPARGQALLRADWDVLANRLLGGICHDINGRAAALTAIAHMSEMYDEPPSPEVLHWESQSLERVVGLVSLLMGDLDGDPEPLVVAEHLPRLVELYSRGRVTDSVDTLIDADETSPPILLNWCLFRRTFLVVLDEITNAASSLGLTVVRIEYRPRDGGLHIGIVALSTEPGDVLGWAAHRDALDDRLAQVSDALTGTNASVRLRESTDDALAADFWFPSLALARGQVQPTKLVRSIELASQGSDANTQ